MRHRLIAAVLAAPASIGADAQELETGGKTYGTNAKLEESLVLIKIDLVEP